MKTIVRYNYHNKEYTGDIYITRRCFDINRGGQTRQHYVWNVDEKRNVPIFDEDIIEIIQKNPYFKEK